MASLVSLIAIQQLPRYPCAGTVEGPLPRAVDARQRRPLAQRREVRNQALPGDQIIFGSYLNDDTAWFTGVWLATGVHMSMKDTVNR